MLDANEFGKVIQSYGYDFFSGVPCSFLKNLINYAINECEYITAANEGDAVATCAGAYLGGRKSVFLCQNSGLTNAESPLTSLTYPFQIPLLGFVSLRGEPGIADEPQHEMMGRITEKLLEDMSIEWQYLSNDFAEVQQQVQFADEVISSGRTFFFVVKKNTFSKQEVKVGAVESRPPTEVKAKQKTDAAPQRHEVLAAMKSYLDQQTVFAATTGYTSRELYAVCDQENNFYMVGSMGCLPSLALGMAIAKPDKKIIAIDGDGALLMRMGSMATLAYYQPKNLLHLVLDNSAYESTGTQDTLSKNVDFVSIASSVRYPKAIYAHDLDELAKAIEAWQVNPTLTFVYLKITPGSLPDLPRPHLNPHEVKQRLMNFLSNRN